MDAHRKPRQPINASGRARSGRTSRPRRAAPRSAAAVRAAVPGHWGCPTVWGPIGARPPRPSLAAEEATAARACALALVHEAPVPPGAVRRHWSRGGPPRQACGGSSARDQRSRLVRCTRALRDRPSGACARLGVGVGLRHRAGALVSTHPANRSPLDRRVQLAALSRPRSRGQGARFGHGPETATVRRTSAGRESPY